MNVVLGLIAGLVAVSLALTFAWMSTASTRPRTMRVTDYFNR